MSEERYLLAYGTLRKEYGKWGQLGMQECEVVGEHTINGELRLFSWFPALKLGSTGNVVCQLIKLIGDIPHIESNLDRYEGADNDFFCKSLIDVNSKQCLVYHWNKEWPNGSIPIERFI